MLDKHEEIESDPFFLEYFQNATVVLSSDGRAKTILTSAKMGILVLKMKKFEEYYLT